jgi:hypothetical protein
VRFPRVAGASAQGLRWWFPLLAFSAVIVLTLDAYWIARQFLDMSVAYDGSAVDWHLLSRAAHSPNPYIFETFRWSPVAAWLLALITPLGITVWRAGQLLAVFTMRDWPAIAVVLLTAPFWIDVTAGQTITFVAVAAWHALRGSRVGTWLFFALVVLMPRPLCLPVLAWLLWKRPETRAWFAAVFAAHFILVIASGLGPDWAARLVASGGEMQHVTNLAPSRWIGWLWAPVGLALAVWFTRRGHLGFATVVASPYVFPYYLLMLVLELPARRLGRRPVEQPGGRPGKRGQRGADRGT